MSAGRIDQRVDPPRAHQYSARGDPLFLRLRITGRIGDGPSGCLAAAKSPRGRNPRGRRGRKMSLVKLIPITLHGVADYVVGVLLLVAPFVFGFSDNQAATWVSIVLGAGAIVASLFTNYPLGAIKLIPVTIHSLADYAVAVVLILAAAFAYGGAQTPTLVHLVIGILVLVVSLLTAYQRAQ